MNKTIVFVLPVAFLLTACAATVGTADLQATVDASVAKALEEQQPAAGATRLPGSGEDETSSEGSLTERGGSTGSDLDQNEVSVNPLATGLGPAPVASRAYVLIAGIPGEARDEAHEGEIDILSWSWGMSQSGVGTSESSSSPTGGTTDPTAGAVAVEGDTATVSDFTVTKYLDKASPKLYQALSTGEEIAEIRLTVQAQGAKKTEYLVITMTKVLVTSANSGGGGDGDRPTESVSLNFEKIKVTYTELDSEGGPVGGPLEYEAVKASHDTAKAIIQNIR
jgi:type VI secretion system secreted protein Hcp